MATADLTQVEDPTLYVYVFFDRHLPGPDAKLDPRLVPVNLFQQLRGAHDLSSFGSHTRLKEQEIDNLNLLHVDRADDGFDEWINRYRTGPRGRLWQAVLYTYRDTLFLQVAIGLGERSFAFTDAKEQLLATAEEVIHSTLETVVRTDKDWRDVERGFLGMNLCYSVLLRDQASARLSRERERTALRKVFPGTPPQSADTRFGHLWRVGTRPVESLNRLPRNLVDEWVLISKTRARKTARAALQTPIRRPPQLPLLFWYRHKFFYQWNRYEKAKPDLRRAEASIEKRTKWIAIAQRDYEKPAQVTGSPEAEELREKTARAHQSLARFERDVLEVTDAHHTLEISLLNYREGSDLVFSARGTDEFFSPERERLLRRAEQMEHDVKYYTGVLQRGKALIESARTRSDLSQERGQEKEVRLGAIQVSGLFAGLMAVLITDILNLPEVARRRPLLATVLLLLGLFGSLAVAQIVLAAGRIRSRMTSFSVAVTAGLFASLALSQNRDAGPWHWSSVGAAFVGAFGIVYTIFRLLEEHPRKKAIPLWRQVRGFRFVEEEIEDLREANSELEDLLDDLPSTQYYRLKKEDAYREKKARKGRVTDVIGIRYIVAPWELPVVVDRVKRALGWRSGEEPGRVKDVEYHSRFGYRSAHIQVDVLGGADLQAEVQVRTYLQHFPAALGHDTIYKSKVRNPILKALKALVWVPWVPLTLLAGLELLIFRRWMNWEKPAAQAERQEPVSDGRGEEPVRKRASTKTPARKAGGRKPPQRKAPARKQVRRTGPKAPTRRQRPR